MAVANKAEIAFFDTIARTAERLAGTEKPEWYLRARLDQMLDDHSFHEGLQRNDVEARAFFILKSFVHMPLKKYASPGGILKANS